MSKIDHQAAVALVEFYLKVKGRKIMADHVFKFPVEFVAEHRLGEGNRNFFGHTYDIFTNMELIEIDDYQKHSKVNQKINDGIIDDFTKKHLRVYDFYRLQKEEIVDSRGRLQPDAYSYLKEHLF